MRKSILIVFTIILAFSVNAQSSLDSLVEYFTIKNLTERNIYFEDHYLNELPWTLTEKFFQTRLNPSSRRSFSIDYEEFDKFILFHFAVPCNAGGLCENEYLVALKHNGEFIDRAEYSHVSVDFGFSDNVSTVSFDSFFLKTREMIEYDNSKSETEQKSLKRTYQLLKVTNSGKFIDLGEQFPDHRRTLPYSSCSILSDTELDSLSSFQLSIARNEIFACYGYKFKTQKWADFFGKKDWYKPTSSTVVEQLNPIEKKNIELLRKREQRN